MVKGRCGLYNIDLTPTLMKTMIISICTDGDHDWICNPMHGHNGKNNQYFANICWEETKYFTLLQTTLVACKRKRRMVLMDGEEDAEVSRIQPRWPLECYFSIEKQLLFQSCRISTRWGWRWRRRDSWGVHRHPGWPDRTPGRKKPKVTTIWTSETNPQVPGVLDDNCEHFLYDHLHADFPNKSH